LRAECGTRVADIQRGSGGSFTIHTQSEKGAQTVVTQTVILALGRTGTPRKLGVPGEQLGKVMYRLIEADHYTHKRVFIVGGGDSAVEAAMGLANQVGNCVTLSYRQAAFSRLKDRNEKRIEEFIKGQKLEVLFNSKPVEIREASVSIDVDGAVRELGNDFVWVFAGGTPPNDFLKKIGVAFGAQDVTAEAHQEAYRASLPVTA
jgi:thioredoxin reductase (NADPH)